MSSNSEHCTVCIVVFAPNVFFFFFNKELANLTSVILLERERERERNPDHPVMGPYGYRNLTPVDLFKADGANECCESKVVHIPIN